MHLNPYVEALALEREELAEFEGEAFEPLKPRGRLSIKILGDAFSVLKRHYLWFLVPSIFEALIHTATNALFPQPEVTFTPFGQSILSLAYSGYLVALDGFLTACFSIVTVALALKSLKGEPIGWRDWLEGFRARWLPFYAIEAGICFAGGVGMEFFFVPGLLAFVITGLFLPALMDRGLSPVMAMRASIALIIRRLFSFTLFFLSAGVISGGAYPILWTTGFELGALEELGFIPLGAFFLIAVTTAYYHLSPELDRPAAA